MMRVSFKFYKSIAYWSYEQGQGVKVDGTLDHKHWSVDMSHANTVVDINDVSEVKDALIETLKKNYLPHDYLAVMDDGRISLNAIEDDVGDVLNDDEQKRAEENGQQSYICDYDVMIEIYEAYEPSAKELIAIFPDAEVMC